MGGAELSNRRAGTQDAAFFGAGNFVNFVAVAAIVDGEGRDEEDL
jgi:hypothetical protein